MVRTLLTDARLLVFAVLAVVGMTATAPAATAGGYAMITIDNPTNNPVYYQVRWGNGDWVSYRLSPHSYRNHYYELNDNGLAPSPYIRFDYLLSDGMVSYRSYHLGFYDSYTTGYWQGKVYKFRVMGYGDILDLKAA